MSSLSPWEGLAPSTSNFRPVPHSPPSSFAIESGMDAKQTFSAMKEGVDAQKHLAAELDQEKVENTVGFVEIDNTMRQRHTTPRH